MRKTALELYAPYCWNCGRDPRGRKLLTVPEAAQICTVAPGTIYRWMDEFRVQWVPTAGGQRRVLGDAAKEYLRHFAKRNRPNSVSRYRKALDHYEDFVGADLPLNPLDVATVRDYQRHRSPQVEPRL